MSLCRGIGSAPGAADVRECPAASPEDGSREAHALYQRIDYWIALKATACTLY
jgi:hypothetical protein